MTDWEDFLQEPEIRIPEIALILGEVQLEIGVSLLIFGHGRVPQVIEIDVLDTLNNAVREPSVHETGSCLTVLGIRSGEGDEVDTCISAVIMHRESRYGGVSAVAHIASDCIFLRLCHGSIVSYIIGLEKMFYFYRLKSFCEGFPVHKLYPDIGSWEEFFSGTPCPLIPLFVVFIVLDPNETGSHEVGSDR